jgi:hypothetical protein
MLHMHNSYQLVCAKWHHSHHKKKFNVVTGWQNLSFLQLVCTSFINSMAIVHQTDTQVLTSNSICYNMEVISKRVQTADTPEQVKAIWDALLRSLRMSVQ